MRKELIDLSRGMTPDPAGGGDGQYRKALFVLLAVTAIFRLFYIQAVELAPDEAYYWTWSRNLQWGYYDHPPLVGFLIWIGTAIAASVLLAGRSLYDHVANVARAVRAGSLSSARVALAGIVGRDTAALNESGVARAAIETLAENFSDGLVAPALWFLLLGLPGMAAYKAINTADSMIGHMTERYTDFGWAAARVDDLVNLPASRLAALLIALAAGNGSGRTTAAFRVAVADAPRHLSPNAGWPEAAMAGALDIALGGPKTYAGVRVNDAWLNAAGQTTLTVADIDDALLVYLGASAIAFAAVAVAALAVLFL